MELEEIYYYGNKVIVSDMIYGIDKTKLSVHVCGDYPSDKFGEISAIPSGNCPRKINSCNIKSRNSNNFILIYQLCIIF